VRLLRRRDREALPRALRRREGAPRAREDALRPAEFPRARRADQPPRHLDQGDAHRGSLLVRGDDALRLPRPPFLARAVEPRARADPRGAAPLWRRVRGVRQGERARGARHAELELPAATRYVGAGMHLERVIAKGAIFDGTGAPRYLADLGLNKGRIEAIAQPGTLTGNDVLSAEGLGVAPGFIDVHSHIDWTLPLSDHQEVLAPMVAQGITTVV